MTSMIDSGRSTRACTPLRRLLSLRALLPILGLPILVSCSSLPHTWRYANLHTTFANRPELKLTGAFEGSPKVMLVVFNPACPADGASSGERPEAVGDLQRINVDYVMHLRDTLVETPNPDEYRPSTYVPPVALALGPVRTVDGQPTISCDEAEAAPIAFPIIVPEEPGTPTPLEAWVRAKLSEDSSIGSIAELSNLGDGIQLFILTTDGALRPFRRGEE